MATLHVRGQAMTSADRIQKGKAGSWLKDELQVRFPDGSVRSAVVGQLDEVDREALEKEIMRWEKDGALERKSKKEIKGTAIKDTRLRFGVPKEYDHFQYSLTREESELFSDADLDRMRNILIETIGVDPTGQNVKLNLTQFHTDTGNSHIDLIVHRHPYDPNGEPLPSDEVTARSRLAFLAEKLKQAFESENLAPLHDVRLLDGTSLYQDSYASDKAKEITNALVEENGGIPNQRTGMPFVPADDVPRPEPQRIKDPDLTALERLLVETEREAKAAAQRFVNAQHAVAAARERTELLEKIKTLDSELAHRDDLLIQERRARQADNKASDEALQQRENELKDEIQGHLLTITQRDDEINSLKKTVDERDTTIVNERREHAEELETLRNQHESALAQALENQRQQHESALAQALENQRQQHESALAQALENQRQQHESALAQALENQRHQHESSLAQALEKQRQKHETELKEANDILISERHQREEDRKEADAQRSQMAQSFQQTLAQFSEAKQTIINDLQSAYDTLKHQFEAYKASIDERIKQIEDRAANLLNTKDTEIARLNAASVAPAGAPAAPATIGVRKLTKEEAEDKRRKAKEKKAKDQTGNDNGDGPVPKNPTSGPKKSD